MSLADYEDFVYRAGFLDQDDPVGRLGARSASGSGAPRSGSARSASCGSSPRTPT